MRWTSMHHIGDNQRVLTMRADMFVKLPEVEFVICKVSFGSSTMWDQYMRAIN